MPIPNDAVTFEAMDPQSVGQSQTPTTTVTLMNGTVHEQSLDDAIGTWLYEGEGGRAYADFRLFQHEEDLILRLPMDAINPDLGLVILPDPDAGPGQGFIVRQVLLEDAWMKAARMGVRIYLTPAG
jgi:hypothetical protein